MTKPRASTYPFSMRLTPEERVRLEAEAAGIPLGSYIRAKVLGEPPPVKLRRSGLPTKDRRSLAKLLSLLGRSRLSSNLNQLAHLANIGALPVTPETESFLRMALADVHEARRLLVMALGLEESPSSFAKASEDA